MTREELIQLQNTQFNILKEVVKICEKYDITYYLVYGTLLGAVRHQGTIPWDYDIDICMDRNNYEKFMEVSKKLPENLEIGHLGSGTNTYTGLSRVYKKGSKIYTDKHGIEGAHAIHIDIFILDSAKKYSVFGRKIVSAMARYLQIAKLSKYEKEWLYELFSGNLKKKAVVKSGELLKFFFEEATMEKWIWNLLVDKKRKREEVIVLTNVNRVYPISYFGKGRLVEYEGEKLNAPEEYEKLLEVWYGDYMQFPPENKRFTADMEKFKIVF